MTANRKSIRMETKDAKKKRVAEENAKKEKERTTSGSESEAGC
jgi:hypothetical protein